MRKARRAKLLPRPANEKALLPPKVNTIVLFLTHQINCLLRFFQRPFVVFQTLHLSVSLPLTVHTHLSTSRNALHYQSITDKTVLRSRNGYSSAQNKTLSPRYPRSARNSALSTHHRSPTLETPLFASCKSFIPFFLHFRSILQPALNPYFRTTRRSVKLPFPSSFRAASHCAGNRKPFRLCKRAVRPLWSIFLKTRICAPSMPSASPSCRRMYSWREE